MNPLKLVLGLAIFLFCLVIAVSISDNIIIFGNPLSNQATDLFRLSLIVIGFVGIFAGVIEK